MDAPDDPAAPTDARAHYEHPAAVLVLLSPERTPAAPAVLSAFEAGGAFGWQASEWGSAAGPDGTRRPIAVVMTVLFERARVDCLARLCREHGLVLVRGALTLVSSASRERVTFDLAAAAAGIADAPPDAADVYTFEARREGEPLIRRGFHEAELEAALARADAPADARADAPADA